MLRPKTGPVAKAGQTGGVNVHRQRPVLGTTPKCMGVPEVQGPGLAPVFDRDETKLGYMATPENKQWKKLPTQKKTWGRDKSEDSSLTWQPPAPTWENNIEGMEGGGEMRKARGRHRDTDKQEAKGCLLKPPRQRYPTVTWETRRLASHLKKIINLKLNGKARLA